MASLEKFTVLLTALSVCFWNAACIRTWTSGVMSCAVAKTRWMSSGTSAMPRTVPASAMRSISSAL